MGIAIGWMQFYLRIEDEALDKSVCELYVFDFSNLSLNMSHQVPNFVSNFEN